jgi:hypothetical protein
VSLDGDFAGLGGLEAALRRMATVPARAAKRAAANLQELVDTEYDVGTGPYGAPWAPLAPSTVARGRHAPPLTDTGAMRASTVVAPTRGAGVSITFGAPYAVYHHTGTSRMPARPVAPVGAAFPRSWERAIREAVDETVRGR